MSESNAAAGRSGGSPRLDKAFLMKEIGDHSWTKAQITAAVKLLRSGKFEFGPGARRVPPPLLASIKRARLGMGMLKAVSALGWEKAGINEILDYSELGRKEFYSLLNNKEELFFALLEFVVEYLRKRIEDAARRGDGWEDRLRLGIEDAVRFLVDEPDAARALLIESRCSGARGIEIFDSLLDHFAEVLDAQARAETSGDAPRLAPAGIVGGIASLLYTRAARGGLKDIGSLASELTQFALAPYSRHTES